MGSTTEGLFIVIDGIDGAGKTVQAQMAASRLRELGYSVRELREPTDSHLGKKIHSLTRETRAKLPPAEEMRWFVEDRKLNIKNNIRPALDQGMVIIQDRYYYSTIAYQGALGLDKEVILKEHRSFLIEPGLVFILDIEPETGISRVKQKRNSALTPFEDLDTLHKVKMLFDAITGDHIHHIDANYPMEHIHQIIMNHILSKLGEVKNCP